MQVPGRSKTEDTERSMSGSEDELNRTDNSTENEMDEEMVADTEEDDIPDLDEEDLEENDLSEEDADEIEWDEPPAEGSRNS